MKSIFGQYHPLACLGYYVAVIILAAVIKAPLFLLVALLLVVLVNIVQDGGQQLRRYMKAYLLMAGLMTVLNPLFSHRGATVLAYLGENALTLESIVYGLTSAMSLLVIVWVFVSFNLIITGDKFLFLFGRIARQSALVAMMALSFIPRLRGRIDELLLVQRSRGLELSVGSIRERSQLLMEVLGGLTAWSLEDGAQMAQSMTARGYGVARRRSSYARYRWRLRDTGFLLMLAALLLILAWSWPLAAEYFAIYPQLRLMDWRQPVVWLSFAVYSLIMALPVLTDLWEHGRYSLWQRRYGALSNQK